MILVIASRVDDAARDLVAEFPRGQAALLTCRDLSRPGWYISNTSPASSTAVADGKRLRGSSIEGVLTLLPCVLPQELVHIVEDDRAYVANEMTSFLLYWLFSLSCPVLNRPTSSCLSGPNWRTEQWLKAAYDLGIPVKHYVRSTRARAGQIKKEDESLTVVTLVGDDCCGSDDDALCEQVRLLAKRAGVGLLSAHFYQEGGTNYLARAHTSVPLDSPQVREAIGNYFWTKA
ncbi:MAG TPA: hypothetical protein VJ715_14815 [Pyrinomonadaceae bacterium]|nr:hypothetical protein [Pyrinomonadaceae bacterium]